MFDQLAQTLLQWSAAHPEWVSVLVFCTALSESLLIVGMLIPGALMMIGFGVLVAQGHLPLFEVCSAAVLGAIAGDGISFYLGRCLRDRLGELWPLVHYPQTLAYAQRFCQQHGGKSVLIGRFIGPLRALVPAIAGALGMPSQLFLLMNVLSALLWAPVYLFPGILLGRALDWLGYYTSLGLLLLAVMAYQLYRRRQVSE